MVIFLAVKNEIYIWDSQMVYNAKSLQKQMWSHNPEKLASSNR